jgi:hypothetical protein
LDLDYSNVIIINDEYFNKLSIGLPLPLVYPSSNRNNYLYDFYHLYVPNLITPSTMLTLQPTAELYIPIEKQLIRPVNGREIFIILDKKKHFISSFELFAVKIIYTIPIVYYYYYYYIYLIINFILL